MSWLLVVQPDPVQAGVLRDALRGQVAEDILVAESLDVALAEIDQRIPDVILLPTLLPAAVEDYLIAYLGAIPSASHVQILGLPRLERSTSQVSRRTWSWFPWRRRVEAQAVGTPVCDPAVFARDVIDYLANARALKKGARSLQRGGDAGRGSESPERASLCERRGAVDFAGAFRGRAGGPHQRLVERGAAANALTP